MTTKLEMIFQIEDEQERRKALVEYAKTLKVNFLHAQRTNGEYSENELAVLIYNAERTLKRTRILNVGFFVAAFFILVFLLVVLYVLVHFLMPKVL
ncbi:MAG: hypothetical protein WC450_02900 [Candidatus Omnitrophota bacterium]|jgi:hypothetical protein